MAENVDSAASTNRRRYEGIRTARMFHVQTAVGSDPHPSMQPKYQPDAVRYVPALTGIRALAALLVLGLHADVHLPAGLHSVLPFFARGYLGVDFFFILS